MKNPITDHIKNHRSIRRFEDRPLPKGLVEELVTCGQGASTSSNLQAYSVIEVSDPKRKKALAELCADQVQIHQSPTFLMFCADLNRDRLAGQLHGVENFDTDYVEALLIATVDAALVLQNVALAAESHGLGICMIGAIRIHPKAVGKLLNLPPLVYAVAGCASVILPKISNKNPGYLWKPFCTMNNIQRMISRSITSRDMIRPWSNSTVPRRCMIRIHAGPK